MNIQDTNHHKVRVRFAPSPTGFLHIGGLRTALFNWLFAQHHAGKFLVRIEDTDRERFLQAYEDAIIDSLQWAGIKADEPYVYQHIRQSEHQQAVDDLIACGKAYYCFCTLDELQQKREFAQSEKETYIYDKTCRDKKLTAQDFQKPYVVRFKVEVQNDFLVFDDLIRGQVSLPTEHIDDFVLSRSDGSMTYNFAVVIDDHFMQISHVIRGEDHIVNTAKQILLYQAFNWVIPSFGHVPLILGPTGQKLSKRDAAVGVQEYKDKGFLPEALCNYLVRLGWSHGDQEVFTTEELIKYFKINDVNKHGAIFDYQKLLWLNGVYIKALTPVQLSDEICENLNINFDEMMPAFDDEQLYATIDLYKDRSQTLCELVHGLMQLYQQPDDYDQESLQQWITKETKILLQELIEALKLEEFTQHNLQNVVKVFAKNKNIKFPSIAQPIRIALIGTSHGPGVFAMMEILGKEASCQRLQKLIA